MVPEFIKTSGYVISSTILHGATILAIAFSPTLMQIGSMDVLGQDPVNNPQMGNSGSEVEIVEINVESPKAESPATHDSAPKAVVIKPAPKKQIENKQEKVAAANVEAEIPKKEEAAPKDDMSVVTIPKSEVLKELAVDEAPEDMTSDVEVNDEKEEVQQVKNEELMPDKNPETSAEETRMLEAVAAADVVANDDVDADQEVDNEINEQLDATPTAEDVAAEMETLPQEPEAKLTDNTEGAALPEKAAAAATPTALPQKGAAQGPSKSEGTKVAKQNFLELRQMSGNQPPSYPERARLRRQEGQGQLKYFVTKDGRVTDLQLVQSTGHSDLDVAAMNSFRKFKFVPGQEGYTVHNFRFALKGKELPARGRLRTTLTKPAVK